MPKLDFQSMHTVNTTVVEKNGWMKPCRPVNKEWLTKKEYVVDCTKYMIVTGKASNITVIDTDTAEQTELVQSLLGNRKTYTVDTRRGKHFYFVYSTRVQTTHGKGIDIQNDGAAVIGEGCKLTSCTTSEEFIYTSNGLSSIIRIPVALLEYLQTLITNVETVVVPTQRTKLYTLMEVKVALSKLNPDDSAIWKKVTACLKGIDHPDVHNLWIEWSRESNKFNLANNQAIWNSSAIIHFNWLFKETKSTYRFGTVDMDLSVTSEEVHVKYINQGVDLVKLRDNNYAIKSTTGTGKTTLAADLVREHFKTKSVLLITSRRSLSQQFKKSFDSLGFFHYTDFAKFQKNLNNADLKVICQINSLGKFKRTDWDLVILDEITSLNSYLFSSQITTEMLLKYQEVLVNSKRFLAIDAGLNKPAVDYLIGMTGSCSVIVNTFKNATDIVVRIKNDLESVETEIKSHIEAGNLPIICSDCKKYTGDIFNSVKDLASTKLYTSDSKNNEVELANADTNWIGSTIIYSPAITTGVDYTADERRVYMIARANETSKGCQCTESPNEMMQQISRCRKLKEIVVYYNGTSELFYETFEDFKDYYDRMWAWDVNTVHGKLKDQSYLKQLFLKTQYNRERTNADQLHYLCAELEAKGFTIIDERGFEKPENREKDYGLPHADITEELKMCVHSLKNEELVETKTYIEKLEEYKAIIAANPKSTRKNPLKKKELDLIEKNSELIDTLESHSGFRTRLNALFDGIETSQFRYSSITKFVNDMGGVDHLNVLKCNAMFSGYFTWSRYMYNKAPLSLTNYSIQDYQKLGMIKQFLSPVDWNDLKGAYEFPLVNIGMSNDEFKKRFKIRTKSDYTTNKTAQLKLFTQWINRMFSCTCEENAYRIVHIKGKQKKVNNVRSMHYEVEWTEHIHDYIKLSAITQQWYEHQVKNKYDGPEI